MVSFKVIEKGKEGVVTLAMPEESLQKMTVDFCRRSGSNERRPPRTVIRAGEVLV
jgi:hypothetical protein